MINLIKRKVNIFSVISIIAVLFILLPLSNLFIDIFDSPSDTWIHIKTYLLAEYIKNTLVLIFFTGLFSAILGFSSAYIVTFYEFKFRKQFSWLLILPLALPSYIAAFIYADMLSYTGIITRTLSGMGINKLIDIMSMQGAIFIFSFTLYPYVYMIVKSSLSKNSTIFIDNAKLLKASKLKIFTKVILPLSRPALVAGTLLVVLETLNDYGVVKYFGVRVFSYAIFDAWFRLSDLSSAVRLSAIAMIIVFLIIFIEKIIRGKRKYTSSIKSSTVIRKKLNFNMQIIVISILSLILLFGFFIPFFELVSNAIKSNKSFFNIETLYIVINTLSITLVSTVLIIIIALMIANYTRGAKSKFKSALLKITNLGYAIPGAVIAISVITFFIDVDNLLFPIYKLFDEDSKKLVLTTSLVILSFAYILRFMTIGYNTIEASYEKTGMKFTEASYLLKTSKIKTLLKIDIPLIKLGLQSAFIIVFIDILKELPLTLILRPTNYDTISTRVYTYASDEMIHEASMPALIIIIISTVLIFVLTHNQKRGVK
ncbi:MAG: iron ABC transporter permease [Candidatus Izemoplasma sp.]